MKNEAQYGQPTQYDLHQAVMFPDFTIEYQGSVDPEEGAEVRSTAGVMYHFYLVKDSSGHEQKVRVVSGQLPAEPVEFSTSKGKFTLYIQRGPHQERLNLPYDALKRPGTLIVSKSS